jgi:hypothetical protein
MGAFFILETPKSNFIKADKTICNISHAIRFDSAAQAEKYAKEFFPHLELRILKLEAIATIRSEN